VSVEYPTHFVKQYEANVQLLQQQMEGRLRPAVSVDPSFVGEVGFYDQLDSIEAVKDATRHGDTVYSNTPHRRRMVRAYTYRLADLVDKPDVVQALNDPASDYARVFAMAMNRAEDDEIIAAFFATAITGKEGTGTEVFPTATHQIVHNSEGLTIAKVLTAKRILDENEVDAMDRTAVVSAKQIEDLLGTTEVTSSDFNTVKALAKGEVDLYAGFRFIRSERLGTAAANIRQCAFFQKRSMKLAISIDKKGRIDEMPGKNYSTQVFYEQRLGATRMDGKGVVEVQCDES
jgi:hypothetical protein